MARPAEALAEPGWLGAMLRSAAIAAALVGLGLALRRSLPALLHDLHPGWTGAAVLVLGGGALTAAGAPRQAVAFAGGYAFGPLAGGALALLAQLLGCAADYYGAATVMRPWVRPRTGARWARLTATLRRHPFRATLTLRLLPLGSNLLVNLAAGAAGVPARAFLAGSLLGYLPQTVIFALLGGGVQVGRSVQVAVAVALFTASALLGFGLARRGADYSS